LPLEHPAFAEVQFLAGPSSTQNVKSMRGRLVKRQVN